MESQICTYACIKATSRDGIDRKKKKKNLHSKIRQKSQFSADTDQGDSVNLQIFTKQAGPLSPEVKPSI